MKPSQPITKPINTTSKHSSLIITNFQHHHYQSSTNHLLPNHKSYSPSQLIAINALQGIFHHAQQVIFNNHCLKNKLTPYTLSLSQSYITQSIKMHLNHYHLQSGVQHDKQPIPLKTDNLIPVGTNIEQSELNHNHFDQISKPQSIRENNPIGKLARNSTVASRTQKQPTIPDPKTTSKISAYVKLNQQDLPKIQVINDPFVEQLRKQKQAKLKQTQQNKKTQKKTNIRDIIKKDQKISYDFNGQIIKIKSNQKGNFVSNSVQGLQNPSLTKKDKQPKIDINAINLDINNRKAADKKALSKKALDIEFSNITSLTPQLEILEGVKFIQGKSVLEKKKKQPSISELKKTISTKRFTRNDFQRLKSLGDNKSVRGKGESLPSIMKSQTDIDVNNQSTLGRSVSQAKFQQKSRISVGNRLNQSSDRMSIQNQELTGMLLEPVHNSIENDAILRAPIIKTQEQSKIALSHIDKANLNYIKTGSVGKIQLPKISYRINSNSTLKETHPITLLQSKSKLKGKRKENQFQRLRKHFEDKLRN